MTRPAVATPAGTRAAVDLAALYRDHGAALLGLGLRLTGGDRYWAEDLVQESMLRAWRHPTPAERPMRPWLAAVLRHLFLDQIRARRRRPQEVADDIALRRQAAAPRGQTPDELPGKLFQDASVATALRALPDTHRQVLIEVYILDRSVAQTAQRLHIAPGTVKSRLFYARRALRAALSPPADAVS